MRCTVIPSRFEGSILKHHLVYSLAFAGLLAAMPASLGAQPAAGPTSAWRAIPYHEDHPVLAYWYGMGQPFGGSTNEDQFRSVAQKAQAAGIDGFILMQLGSLDMALRAVRGSDFRVSVHLHPPHDVAGFYRHIEDPNLVTYQGRPVLFTWQARTTTPERWQDLRDRYDPNHQAVWLADGDKFDILANDAFDGISPYAIAWSNAPAAHLGSWAARSRTNGPEKLFVPPVSPGCALPPQNIHDGRDPCVQDRRDGGYYRATWDAALATRPAWAVVVSTWDEEAEGTGISPRVEWGDLYLQLTGEYASRFNGSVTTPVDEPQPEGDGGP
jgi:hypothetical protein